MKDPNEHSRKKRKTKRDPFHFYSLLPNELKAYIWSFLDSEELTNIGPVNKQVQLLLQKELFNRESFLARYNQYKRVIYALEHKLDIPALSVNPEAYLNGSRINAEYRVALSYYFFKSKMPAKVSKFLQLAEKDRYAGLLTLKLKLIQNNSTQKRVNELSLREQAAEFNSLSELEQDKLIRTLIEKMNNMNPNEKFEIEYIISDILLFASPTQQLKIFSNYYDMVNNSSKSTDEYSPILGYCCVEKWWWCLKPDIQQLFFNLMILNLDNANVNVVLLEQLSEYLSIEQKSEIVQKINSFEPQLSCTDLFFILKLFYKLYDPELDRIFDDFFIKHFNSENVHGVESFSIDLFSTNLLFETHQNLSEVHSDHNLVPLLQDFLTSRGEDSLTAVLNNFDFLFNLHQTGNLKKISHPLLQAMYDLISNPSEDFNKSLSGSRLLFKSLDISKSPINTGHIYLCLTHGDGALSGVEFAVMYSISCLNSTQQMSLINTIMSHDGFEINDRLRLVNRLILDLNDRVQKNILDWLFAVENSQISRIHINLFETIVHWCDISKEQCNKLFSKILDLIKSSSDGKFVMECTASVISKVLYLLSNDEMDTLFNTTIAYIEQNDPITFQAFKNLLNNIIPYLNNQQMDTLLKKLDLDSMPSALDYTNSIDCVSFLYPRFAQPKTPDKLKGNQKMSVTNGASFRPSIF